MSTRQERVRSLAASALAIAADNHYRAAWVVEQLADVLVDVLDELDASARLADQGTYVWSDERWTLAAPQEDGVYLAELEGSVPNED